MHGVSDSFPDGFLWGTATAAHQIEGGNVNNDWWAFEHAPGSLCAESSGDACDSFNRYPEDIDLVAGLGLGAYRFSLEWSRIEPEEGEFSRVALDHYRRMMATCLERGVAPVVTFHHFTHPRWLAAMGTWEAPEAPDRFARFCGRTTEHLGDLLGMVCTLNEPNVVATMGWRHGLFPPGVRDRTRRAAVNEALVAAHRKGCDAIRSGPGEARVGLTLSMTDYQLEPGGESWIERLRGPSEDVFLDATGGDDFVGVQTYTRMRVGPDGPLGPEPGVAVTQMGYEFWPEALEGHHPPGHRPDRRRARLRHRERHRHGRRRRSASSTSPGRSAGCAGASRTASMSAATSTGACSTISSGFSATCRRLASSRWTGRLLNDDPNPALPFEWCGSWQPVVRSPQFPLPAVAVVPEPAFGHG